jgi:hypothetical protein
MSRRRELFPLIHSAGLPEIADISQLFLSHCSGEDCAQGISREILAFSGGNMPILG